MSENIMMDTEASTGKKEKKGKEEALQVLQTSLEGQTTPEAKLQLAIEFMEGSLAQNGIPNFRNFWESRRLCLQFFKENINPTERTRLWNKYSELSQEARRLKDLLDEQSAFAMEQIEIAIKACEDEIENSVLLLEKSEAFVFPISCKTLYDNEGAYCATQHELNFLNTIASRLNSLRRELIKTDMRVHHKNRLFERLSAAGDKVFPRRKELIQTISTNFAADVNGFIQHYFAPGSQLGDALFYCREEIKSLQAMAKILTLNTQTFTETRTQLSECWNTMKQVEKERKQEFAAKKSIFKENYDRLSEELKQFVETFQAGTMTPHEGDLRLDELSNSMRRTELGRDEVRALRDEMGKAHQMVTEKLDAVEAIRRQQETERDRVKNEKVTALRQRLETACQESDRFDLEGFQAERDALVQAIREAQLTRTEQQELDRFMKKLKELLQDKREKALLTLPADEREALQQLQQVLKQRKERRQEVKDLLETFRKSSGNSGFDFAQAMQNVEQVAIEKERLEKINESISEIETQIASLESKIFA